MKILISKFALKIAAKAAKNAPSGGRPASYFRHCPKVTKGLGRFFGSWRNAVKDYNRLDELLSVGLKASAEPPKGVVALQHFSQERRNGRLEIAEHRLWPEGKKQFRAESSRKTTPHPKLLKICGGDPEGSTFRHSLKLFFTPRGKTQFVVFTHLFGSKKVAIGSHRWEHWGARQRARLSLVFASALLAAGILLLAPASPAGADGISIAPLKYQTNLDGKIEKGAVDITNLSGFTENITMEVQAFRQIDDKGTLQFYSNPLVSAGITPDYNQFQLKPGERIHLYFLLNGQKLPKTRIFAALLAQAKPVEPSYSITPILRVGTLLMLKNGSGDLPKRGQVNDWRVSLFQFGDGVSGQFNFKNTETGNKASGYFPNFTVKLGSATDSFSGDLVFPGINRPQHFSLPGSRIGIYHLRLSSDANTGASQWVVVLTGYWRWLLPLLVIIVVGLLVLALRWHKSRKSPRS